MKLPNGKVFGHRKYKHFYNKKIVLRDPIGPAYYSLMGKYNSTQAISKFFQNNPTN